jgi:hypothetical protein
MYDVPKESSVIAGCRRSSADCPVPAARSAVRFGRAPRQLHLHQQTFATTIKSPHSGRCCRRQITRTNRRDDAAVAQASPPERAQSPRRSDVKRKNLGGGVSNCLTLRLHAVSTAGHDKYSIKLDPPLGNFRAGRWFGLHRGSGSCQRSAGLALVR